MVFIVMIIKLAVAWTRTYHLEKKCCNLVVCVTDNFDVYGEKQCADTHCMLCGSAQCLDLPVIYVPACLYTMLYADAIFICANRNGLTAQWKLASIWLADMYSQQRYLYGPIEHIDVDECTCILIRTNPRSIQFTLHRREL